MSRFRQVNGREFDLAAPDPEAISPEMIAHALAMICRYGGHVPSHYSVAQHSVEVARLLPRPLQLAGLLHDAHEGLGIGDIIGPAKALLKPAIKEVEARVDRAVAERFGLQFSELRAPPVKRADLILLRTEQRDLRGFGPHLGEGDGVDGLERRLRPWRAARARRAWLAMFYDLTRTGERAPLALRIARRIPWMA